MNELIALLCLCLYWYSGYWFGEKASRDEYKRKLEENEKFWLARRDEWLSFFNQPDYRGTENVYNTQAYSEYLAKGLSNADVSKTKV
jgi:hypothetical protein